MKNTFKTHVNPYLPLWEHLPDGEPKVFEDPDNPGRYRIYIIGSHDVRYDSYCGPDIRAWSAPVDDLSQWRDEGPIFTYKIDNQWDVMYAPDLVEVKRKDGTKEYYLYPNNRGEGRDAMVAKGSSPIGPFEAINMTDDGRGTLPGSIMGFDPAVYIDYITDPNDPDYDIGFRAYGYWGFKKSHACQLDQNTMYGVRPGTEIIEYFIPSGSAYGEICDPEGLEYPYVCKDEDLVNFNFFEAASIRKVGNKYVWIYSGYSGPEYGLDSTNSALRYAYGDSPLGPWKSGGVLVDSRAPVPGSDGSALMTSYAGHNTHGSIELINDQWYVFYHRAPREFANARQPMVAPVNIFADEETVENGGKVLITAYDPYSPDNTWYAGTDDFKYSGAEVTSEGFHIFGLDPYKYYSAGIACFLSDFSLQSDSWDIWDNNAPIVDVKGGDIVGYKYFGFGGLSADTKGIKAFEGTGINNNSVLNLFLNIKTKKPFKINIWLDSPWNNAKHHGVKIGEIDISDEIIMQDNSTLNKPAKYTVNVSHFVDNLSGKHALYLVAEGESEPLFDLIGLGFSAYGKEIDYPVVPEIEIKINDIPVNLPQTPVRSTNQNGITDYDFFEASLTLPTTTQSIDVIASSNNPDVQVDITKPDTIFEDVFVKFTYLNIEKTYKVTVMSEKYLC